MMIPLGTYTTLSLRTCLAGPARAGHIASRNGSAMAAPEPRSSDRLERCFPVIILIGMPLLLRMSFLLWIAFKFNGCDGRRRSGLANAFHCKGQALHHPDHKLR